MIGAPAARQNDAAKLCVSPRPTLAAPGAIEFAAPHITVTLALPDFVASATLVAVTLTVGGEGGVKGAVYTEVLAPFGTTVPTVVLPPGIPFTLQVTLAAPLPVPLTLAVKTCPPPAGTSTGLGVTLTAMLSINVTAADALACESALLTASTMMLADEGIAAGAVYSPPVKIVPALALPPITPFNSHVTDLSVVPITTA